TRSRKLLAKRKEIERLVAAKQQGLAIIPLEIMTRGHYIKLKIATARGKRMYDKRQVLKKRDELRQIGQDVKL
ncbi:MAG TPA: SsrA-binding protein, partial [Patescibacteria group bacterium]|nr:SsrA-binding protein [Patescibacteria group bacterium]